jgi:hypothetical protein
MVSKSKLALVATIAVFALLLSGTAQAGTVSPPGLNQGTGAVAAAWNWIVSVFVPGSPTSSPTVGSGEPKAGCEMDPNGAHFVPGDPSSSGVSISVH